MKYISNLNTLKAKVRYILEHYPTARENDRWLIKVLYQKFYNVHFYDAFGDVVMNEKLPSFESIRRCRQKIQEEDESLRGGKESEKARLEKQVEYIEFAKEGA